MTPDLHERADSLHRLTAALHRDIARAYDSGAVSFIQARALLATLRGDALISERHARRLLAEARANATKPFS